MKAATCTTLALAAGLLLTAVAVWWAPLNQDEGWYLMATRRVSEGAQPYRDFAYTQPPVFPYLNQAAQPLVNHFGVLGGRLASAGWGWIALGLTLWGARRYSPAASGALAVTAAAVMLAFNVAGLQYWATVKTYSLAGLLLLLATLGWLEIQRTPGFFRALLCGACCALAAGTRLSLAMFPVALTLDLLLRRRDLGGRALGGFLLGCGIVLGGLLLPFLLTAPEGLRFGLWDYHVGRETHGGLLPRLAFLARWIRAILPIALAGLFVFTARRTLSRGHTAILGGVGLVTLVHGFAPFPYDEYQTVLLPVLALVVAIEFARACPVGGRRDAPALLLAVGLLTAAASPALQNWLAGERDRLWWPAKAESELAGLRRAAETLNQLDPGGSLLLTVDTYLAIESRRDVPSGLEMGPFSFFPDLSTEQAQRLHVVNTAMLEELILTTDATAAALSGYAFTISSPALTRTPRDQVRHLEALVESRFAPAAKLAPFGQAGTELRMFVTD